MGSQDHHHGVDVRSLLLLGHVYGNVIGSALESDGTQQGFDLLAREARALRGH